MNRLLLCGRLLVNNPLMGYRRGILKRTFLYLLLSPRKFLLVNYLYVVRMGVGWTNWRGLNVLVVLILVILKRTFLHLLLFLRKFLLRKFLLVN